MFLVDLLWKILVILFIKFCLIVFLRYNGVGDAMFICCRFVFLFIFLVNVLLGMIFLEGIKLFIDIG